MSFKKKSLGQHFLKDVDLAKKIAGSILLDETTNTKVIEIGPGQGALTKHLLDLPLHLSVIEKDDRFAEQIPQLFPVLSNRVIHDDVLKINWREVMKEKPVVAGNFPYNISNLILFKIFENRDLVPQMVGMFQKEVAERIASKGKNKAYGKLSVLLQSYYDVTYLFDVPATAFDPPPRVVSGVVRMTRKETPLILENTKLFTSIVKAAFGQRRKKLSNSLKSFQFTADEEIERLMNLRPEQIDHSHFYYLYKNIIDGKNTGTG